MPNEETHKRGAVQTGGRPSVRRSADTASSSRTMQAHTDEEPKSRLFRTPGYLLAPRLILIVSVVVLCVLGLIMVYSSSMFYAYAQNGDSNYYLIRQGIYMAVGLVACIVCAIIPYHFWSHRVVFIILWLASVVLLAVIAFGYGVENYGAERALEIGVFSLQPSEFAKVTVLLALASFIVSIRQGDLSPVRGIICCCIVVIVPVLFIYQQPDLGTVIILAVGVLALLLLGGISYKVIIGLILVVIAYFVVVSIVQPYHLERIMSVISPDADTLDSGYQSQQALYAFGIGGFFGTGLGLSHQKYLYLPMAYNDSIFAIIGEELGLLGAVFVVLLFALFVYAGILIARRAPDLLGCMFAGSMTTMIGFQACLNILCTIGLAPITGKALPFISYGGSSLLASLVMVGIILSVSIHSRVDARYVRRRENLRVLEGGQSRKQSQQRQDQPARPQRTKQQPAARSKAPAAASSQRSSKRPASSERGRPRTDSPTPERSGSRRSNHRSSDSRAASRPASENSRSSSRNSSARERSDTSGSTSSPQTPSRKEGRLRYSDIRRNSNGPKRR
ncbi:MAG: putative lipid II flippase FtsW [Coriobacteriaceae bacterium]|nr:putative lipid II flippase FtsW [Coriobacteriaceae bacterium]